MGNQKPIITVLIFLTGFSLGAFAQSGEKKDPFKNDPFFSRPLSELLKLPADSNTSDSLHGSRDFKGYVHRMNSHGLDLDGALESGPYNSNSLYGVYPNLPMIHFNRVDVLFLGLRKERMQWYNSDRLFDIPSVHAHGMLGYSTGQAEWQYVLGLERYFGRKDHVIFGGEFHSATTTDDYWRVGMTETSITSFLAGYDYLDYYKQHGWGTYVLFRTDRLFEGGVAYADDRFSSQSKKTNFALFGSGGRYRPNPPVDVVSNQPVDEIHLASLHFSASFNPKRLLLSRYFTLSLSTQVELGDPGIGESGYDFNRYLGEMTYFFNFEKGGVFKHRIRVGSITGNAPLMKSYFLGGLGTLRALPYKSLGSSNQMVLSNAEIQFGNPGFGSTDWIDFDDFYLTFFLDSGWNKFDPAMVSGNNPFEVFSSFSFAEMRHNAGIGVGSSLFRAELAWDLDNTGRSPVLWIRLNPTF